jgi:transcriptional regulator with PAS, ATPase and Fis domain
METGSPIINRPIFILRADGGKVPVSISTALLKDAGGNIVGGVETFRDLSMEEELKRELHASYTFTDIISRNHRMQEIFAVLPAVAESPSTVLIEGESGTGKELVCRAIHNLSPRKDKPFVAMNCGALPDSLLESELFGYTAGAFTDARTNRPGRIALAEGGTLFLDEIGDVSPALQVRLLRFLQEKEYEPLGSGKTLQADVRVIAATNRSLEQLVKKGQFRSDLYYRINIMRIVLPPLRNRREDIPLLADHFVRRFNKLHKREIEGISDAAMAALMHHDYPGNIRELENAVEHAFVLCRTGLIRPEHLPAQFHKGQSELPKGGPMTLREMEIIAITDALRRNGYHSPAAARDLGIHKTTLYRKIREYNITQPGRDSRFTGSERSK